MPDSMLAGRLNVRTKEFEVKEVPRPTPGPGQVLVEVRAAGICLSDVHLVEGQLNPLFLQGDEVTLGHEVAGVVAEVGEGVTGWAGRRVTLQAGEEVGGWIHTRGVDYDGGWAQYALSTVETLVPIPDSLPFEQACIVPDAVSTPWASIVNTAGVRAGEPVGVWGIGGLGAHARRLDDRGPRRRDGVRDDARLLEGQLVGDGDHRLDGGQRVLRPPAVVVDAAGVDPPVHLLAGLQGDPLPGLPAGHALADPGDHAGDLVPEGDLVALQEQRVELALDEVDVGQADARGADPDQHLPGAGARPRHLPHRELPRPHVQPAGQHGVGQRVSHAADGPPSRGPVHARRRVRP